MEAGRVFEVAKRAFIGTSPRIRVCLDDPSLKTIHAAVTVAGGRVEIVDAGGTGLLVNGNRVVRADLAPGDLVGIGRTVLRVERSAPGKGVEARRG
jgi:pSer/pThr/pTyr-binding forkhead associated (FHA) protein